MPPVTVKVDGGGLRVVSVAPKTYKPKRQGEGCFFRKKHKEAPRVCREMPSLPGRFLLAGIDQHHGLVSFAIQRYRKDTQLAGETVPENQNERTLQKKHEKRGRRVHAKAVHQLQFQLYRGFSPLTYPRSPFCFASSVTLVCENQKQSPFCGRNTWARLGYIDQFPRTAMAMAMAIPGPGKTKSSA